MTRLAEIPRVKLTQGDKTTLMEIATQYEEAQGLYTDWSGHPMTMQCRKAIAQAGRARAAAVQWLMDWANRRLTEDKVGIGFPHGAAFPRLRKAYDAGWDHRKWGSAGCAREAAKTIRNIVKRGWI